MFLFNSATHFKNILISRTNSTAYTFLSIVFGVIVLTISAQLTIPLRPVPLTFQSATVILIGMAYGARYGSYVVGSYLLAGFLGLPVFAEFSAGPLPFVGPTGGYLLGFLPAAFIAGWLAEKGLCKNWLTSFLAACIGVSIIFILGILKLSQFLQLYPAIEFGFKPFILSELIKLLGVAFIIPTCWKHHDNGN